MNSQKKFKKISVYRVINVLNGQIAFRKLLKVYTANELEKFKKTHPGCCLNPLNENQAHIQPNIMVEKHTENIIQKENEPILQICPAKSQESQELLPIETTEQVVNEEHESQLEGLSETHTPIFVGPLKIEDEPKDDLYTKLYQQSQKSNSISALNEVIVSHYNNQVNAEDIIWSFNQDDNWNITINQENKLSKFINDVKLAVNSLMVTSKTNFNYDAIESIIHKTKFLESLNDRLNKVNLNEFAKDNSFLSLYIANVELQQIENQNNLAKFSLTISLKNGFSFANNTNQIVYNFDYQYQILSIDNFINGSEKLSTSLADLYISNFDVAQNSLNLVLNETEFAYDLKVLSKKQNGIHRDLNIDSEGQSSLSPNVYYYEFGLTPKTNFSISKSNFDEIEKMLVASIVHKIKDSGKIKQIPYILEYIEQNTNFLSLIQDHSQSKLVLVMQSRILDVSETDFANFVSIIQEFNKTSLIKNVSVLFQNLGILDLLNSADWLSLVQNPFIGKYSHVFGFNQSANLVIDFRNVGEHPIEMSVEYGVFDFSSQLWNWLERNDAIKLTINPNNLNSRTICLINHKFGKRVLLASENKFNNPLDMKTVIKAEQVNNFIDTVDNLVLNHQFKAESFTMEWLDENKVIYLLSDKELRLNLLAQLGLNDTNTLNVYATFNDKNFVNATTMKLFVVNKIGFAMISDELDNPMYSLSGLGEFIEQKTNNNPIQFGYPANDQFINKKFANQDVQIPTEYNTNENILKINQLLFIKKEFKLN